MANELVARRGLRVSGSTYIQTVSTDQTLLESVLAIDPSTREVKLLKAAGLNSQVFVSGGTVTGIGDKDLLFTNTTGGTFTVTNGNVFVTGGTYNDTAGQITFTNNSGGTFQVGGWDYFSAATISDNQITLTDNGGVNTNLQIDAVTGLTYSSDWALAFNGTGNIGTTPFELPFITGATYTPLTDTLTLFINNGLESDITVTGFEASDTFVTGGTLTQVGGTIALQRNDGNTVNLANAFTYVTGGTYNNGSLILTLNDNSTDVITGVTSGSGTPTYLPIWDDAVTLGDSIVSQTGTTVYVGGNLNISDLITNDYQKVKHLIGGANFYSGGGDNGGAYDGDYSIYIGDEAFDGAINTGDTYTVNTGLGYGTFNGSQNITYHTAVGAGSMRNTIENQDPDSTFNYTGTPLIATSYGVSIGANAGRSIPNYNESTLIGNSAGYQLNAIFRTMGVGEGVLKQSSPGGTTKIFKSTILGSYSAYDTDDLEHVVAIGHEAILNAYKRSDSILIGDYVGYNSTVNDSIFIGNYRKKNQPINFGTPTTQNVISIGHFVQPEQQNTINFPTTYDMGLGTYKPTEKLDINGNLRIRSVTNADFVYTDISGVTSGGTWSSIDLSQLNNDLVYVTGVTELDNVVTVSSHLGAPSSFTIQAVTGITYSSDWAVAFDGTGTLSTSPVELPFITGATYVGNPGDSGTLTLNINGGIESDIVVSGFSGSDTFVTGASVTYSAATLTRNDDTEIKITSEQTIRVTGSGASGTLLNVSPTDYKAVHVEYTLTDGTAARSGFFTAIFHNSDVEYADWSTMDLGTFGSNPELSADSSGNVTFTGGAGLSIVANARAIAINT